MIAIATPVLMLALGATSGHNENWLQVSESSPCSMTDVDFSDPRHGFASCAFSDAMTTDDGGLTWTTFGTGLMQSLLYAHAAGPDDLWAARLGIYHSSDGGDTWNEVGGLSDGGSGSVFDVHFGDAGPDVAIQGGQILYSDDGGESWNVGYPGKFGVYFDELHFTSAEVGYASGGSTSEQGSIGSVLRSEDGGHSWTLLQFTHGEITAADFFDDDDGVAATIDGALWSTADGGASWQSAGALPDSATLLDLVHRDANHWYGVSIQGCIYETRDAGASWETGFCDPNGTALAAITVAGGAAVAGGNDGLALYENRILTADFD